MNHSIRDYLIMFKWYQMNFQILLIQKSWESLSGDMTSKGMRIFKEIFARDPDAKALFPFRNARMEDLPNDVKFRGHASRLAICSCTPVIQDRGVFANQERET